MPSTTDLEELCIMRVTLEADALRLSVPRLTSEDIDRLECSMAEKAHDAEVKDYRRWTIPHARFQRALTAPARVRVNFVPGQMFDQAERYRRLHIGQGPSAWGPLVIARSSMPARQAIATAVPLCRRVIRHGPASRSWSYTIRATTRTGSRRRRPMSAPSFLRRPPRQADLTPERTHVAIIGAGPAGLLLAHLLHMQGVEFVALEARSREYCEARIRTGVLEQGTRDVLIESAVGARLEREGLIHGGIYLRFDGQSHHIPMSERTDGRCVTNYGHAEVVKDLIAYDCHGGRDRAGARSGSRRGRHSWLGGHMADDLEALRTLKAGKRECA